MDSRYDPLLEEGEGAYQPPRFNTFSTIQEISAKLQKGFESIDLLSSFNPKQYSHENDIFNKELDQYLVDVHPFHVEYVKFPIEIPKQQVRKKNCPNQMRLSYEESKIILHLSFDNMALRDIYQLRLKVKRLNFGGAPKNSKFFTGFANLHPVELKDVVESTVAIYANLDDLDEAGEAVNMYKLTTGKAEHNEFNLYIEVIFHDGSMSKFTSRSFRVKGPKAGDKRKAESPGSLGSPDSVYSPLSTDSKSPRFVSFKDPSENKNYADHQRIVYEYIEAKKGIFDNLEANIIKTGKGDIAYHFVLKDQTSNIKCEPGEVVGFTEDSSGKVVIDKLSSTNASQTFLKGVVTESQYIEAFNPRDRNVITATICMLGVVPVRIVGSVLPGDGLYASQTIPGTAVSEKAIGSGEMKAHIGYAFERVDAEKDELNEVQALVSIIGSAGQDLCVRQLSALETSLKHSIRFNTVRSRKCFVMFAVAMLIGLSIIGTIIYQVKVPCSMYRKYLCKEGNTGSAQYWFWTQGGEYFGYRFKSCEVVWGKTFSRRPFFRRPHRLNGPPQCVNDTSPFHYYINFDSCCGVDVPGARYMFAVNAQCNALYVFDEVWGKWRKEKRVCADGISCKGKG